MIYFSFQMTEHIYTLPLVLKDIFTDYKILDCQFFFSILFYLAAAGLHDFQQISVIFFIFCPLYVTCPFFHWILFKEFGYDVSWYNFLHNSYTLSFFNFYTHGIIIFIKFEKYSVLFSTLFFLSFSCLCLL